MTQNLILLADVGGTNTRFALANSNGMIKDSSWRYANNEVNHFTDAARDYLSRLDGKMPTTLCCAIAGPVAQGHGVLTNGNWIFDSAALPEQLGMENVYILNDLVALGYALEDLPPMARIKLGGGNPQGNQSLVAGIATGFNVSLSHGDRVAEAELGHASIPFSVIEVLEQAIGSEKARQHFPTIESLFSGAGLATLHLAMGFDAASPAQITRLSGNTVHVFARALATLCREMSYLYMPLGGLYLNGSVARAVTEAVGDHKIILEELEKDTGLSGRFRQIPVFLITQDSAALYGCARYARLQHAS